MSTNQNSKETSLATRLVCALVASIVTMGVSAQTTAKRPSLVVGIVIEGLNEDYLDLLRHRFGGGGFKLLYDRGVLFENVEYGHGIDPTAATAMIMTGTTPSVNGIVGSTIYDIETKRAVPILRDPQFVGNFTNENYSPQALLVSTISDEVRISEDGLGAVYAIAPEPQTAVILASHAGNSGIWINDVDGKWSTTTFYKDMPAVVSKRNYSMPLSSRLDTLTWHPSLSLDKYIDLPEHKKQYPFTNRFPRNERDRYRMFKASATVNTEITDLAIEYIKSTKIGTRGYTDMLNLAYTVTPYPYSGSDDNRIDTQDAYIKLDHSLEQLFKTIQSGPGLDNTAIFVAGIPATPAAKRDNAKWNIPYGEFSPRKAISLLNMYLIAVHGNGEWVTGYHSGQFYLNQKFIKERSIDLQSIRSEAAEFISRMSGVSRVYTIDDIIAGRIDDADKSLRRNTSLAHAGDIVVTIAPGWEIVEDDSLGGNASNGRVSRLGTQSSPVFIVAPGLHAEIVSTPVDACIIAPTVARILRIRSPNAASMTPLRLR